MSYEIPNAENHLQVSRGLETDKIEKIEENVEFLLEQIESLKLDLCHKNYELQELSYTNQELCAALDSQPLTIDEAMELTKTLLASEKLTQNILVELLIAINSSWCVSNSSHYQQLECSASDIYHPLRD